jgi:hypothetical protein
MPWQSVKIEQKNQKLVIFQGGKTQPITEPIAYPSICPCCGKKISQINNRFQITTEEVTNVAYSGSSKRITTRKSAYNFPMCSDCYIHTSYWDHLKVIPAFFIVAFMGIVVFGLIFLHSFEILGVLIGILVIATIISLLLILQKTKDHMKSDCVSQIPIKGGEQGELHFGNKLYAEQFAALNNALLVQDNTIVDDNFDAAKQQQS